MNQQIINSAKKHASEFYLLSAGLMSFIAVESGGQGFSKESGKIIIQFEPSWFKKQAPYAPSGLWSLNKVERQSAEWKAFNDAFARDPEAAMEATSIGLGQILGVNWKRLGYNSVGEMWDDAKSGIDRQVWQIAKFIDTDERLKKALRLEDWPTVARIYNGPKYKEIAVKYGRTPYDEAMAIEFKKYKTLV